MKKLLPFQKKNLKFFFGGLILSIIAVIFILYSMSDNFLSTFEYRSLKHFGSTLGTICEILFFIVIALWCIRLVIRHLTPKTFNFVWTQLDKTKLKLNSRTKESISAFLIEYIRSFLIWVSKIIQKFHIPLAMIGLSIISIHVYIFLHLGFKWTIGYIFGALAAIVLLILVLSGILRIFNKGLKTHKHLGIIFVILMLLHIIFI